MRKSAGPEGAEVILGAFQLKLLAYANTKTHNLKPNDVLGQDCSKAIPLEGSNMVFTSTQETFGDGTKANFECSTGYIRAGGSRSVICTAGVWSTVTLTCELRPCGSPGEVMNGRYNLSGVLFGDRAVAFCDTGYMLVGSGVRNCMVDGWDGRVPVCEVVKCGKPPTIVNGGLVIPPDEEYHYRSVVEYSCEKEFTLVGTKSIVCEKDGEFQPAPPECKMVSCLAPVVENGVRIEGSLPPYQHKSFVTYKCNDGYKMMGEASLTCEIEGWSASIPTCKDGAPGPTSPPAANNHTWKIVVGVLGGLGFVCVTGCIVYKYKARARSSYLP